jgi:hypothetical protein
MFAAILIVCAATFTDDVDTNRCLTFDDTLGPYITEANCKIRAAQMERDVVQSEITPSIFFLLGMPQKIAVKGFCERTSETAL